MLRSTSASLAAALAAEREMETEAAGSSISMGWSVPLPISEVPRFTSIPISGRLVSGAGMEKRQKSSSRISSAWKAMVMSSGRDCTIGADEEWLVDIKA